MNSLLFSTFRWGSLFALLIGATSVVASGTQLYKWVDDQGLIHYSDTRPVQSEDETKILDRQGRPIGTIQSGAQYRAEQEAAARKDNKSLDPASKQAQDRDRALLQSYLSANDFDVARDSALEVLNHQTKAVRAVLETQETRYKEAIARLNAGQVVPEGEIPSLQKEIEQRKELLKRYQDERVKIIQRYQSDKLRWLELQAVQLQQEAVPVNRAQK